MPDYMNHPVDHYVGRFAPSPSGPLHAGSLVAAMASYLDAKAHHGRWLLRMEDIDDARSADGAAADIAQTLAALGMQWDGPIRVQSECLPDYQAACARLDSLVYPCGCTRREIADSGMGLAADGAVIYPGTCRTGLAAGKTARALRVRVPDRGTASEFIQFEDRWLGRQTQYLAHEVGDFVLKRADGYWAYQLAVVVDDALQGVTHVVRGADLLDSTARQIYLQRLLGYPVPVYLHVPLVCTAEGEKLSKQHGAQALDLQRPLHELQRAAGFLGLGQMPATNIADFWSQAQQAWTVRLQQGR